MTGGRLSVENLSRRFGGLLAVDDVSVDFEPGEVCCVIGPNGAGKSTLLNLICGTLQPSAGRVMFEGRSLDGRARHRIAQLGIARKFQVPSVFGSMTVAENLAVAEAGSDRAEGSQGIEEVLSTIGLEAERDTLAAHLAHGSKQWLEIGMALTARPALLLLDEPTAGLTGDETSRIARLILSMRGRMTVLVIDHDMHFVRELASRTVVMHQGRIVASGAFRDIEENELVRDIYLGRQ